MSHLKDKLQALKQFQEDAIIRIQTLGQFNLWRDKEKVILNNGEEIKAYNYYNI